MSVSVEKARDIVLRFDVGDRVQCNVGHPEAVWVDGKIIKLWYTQRSFDGKLAPYQVQLDSGRLIYASVDVDYCIRALGAPPGAASTKKKKKRKKRGKQNKSEMAREEFEDDDDDPLPKRTASQTSDLIDSQGWERALPELEKLLSKHCTTQKLCHKIQESSQSIIKINKFCANSNQQRTKSRCQALVQDNF